MRIGVNALYLLPGGVGGTEIYLRNLLRAMASVDPRDTFYVFTNRETPSTLVPPAVNFIHEPRELRASNRPLRLVAEQTLLPLAAKRLRLDCMFNPGFTAPALAPCPNVTVFHDLQHKRHPEHFRWFDLPAWNFFLNLSVRRSEMIVVDSESTKADLMRFYGVPESRIRVALLGVEPEFFSIYDRRTATEPLLLCVSTLHPHKNLKSLIRVFARFRENHPEWRLVLAGMRGFQTGVVESLITSLQLEEAVVVTGWIPRLELYDFYRRARAFVYPSTFEGFGLPVVEAMAAGVPLACSDIEPLRSIVGDAAIRFNPHDDESMLRAIEQVTSSSDLVARGRERAHLFTWEECARRTLDAIYTATGADLPVELSRPSSSRDI